MKISELKIGTIISHYCCGNWIVGTVIESDGRSVKTMHEPVQWGNDTYTETWVNPSTPLQAKYHSPTTPKAMLGGELITI